MYLPLGQETVQVEPLSPHIPTERTAPVEVLVIGSLFCPVGSTAVLYLRRVAREFAGQTVLKEVPASREALERYGAADGIFVNGQPRRSILLFSAYSASLRFGFSRALEG
jgi:hypothetical protein